MSWVEGKGIWDYFKDIIDNIKDFIDNILKGTNKELKDLGNDFMGATLNNLENNVWNKTTEIQNILSKKLESEDTILNVLSKNKNISDYMTWIWSAEQSKKDLWYEILLRCIKKESNDEWDINESDLKKWEFNELWKTLWEVQKIGSDLESSTWKSKQEVTWACITVLEGLLKTENYDITKIKIDDNFKVKVNEVLQQQNPVWDQQNPAWNQENPAWNQQNPDDNSEDDE